MKRTLILLTVLCVFAVTFAQKAPAQQPKPVNVSGNWDVVTKTATGDMTEKWTIRQDGIKISGTVKTPQGDMPVSGDMVPPGHFFRVAVKFPDGDHLIRATAEKDEMDGSVTIGRAEYLWFAKRSK